MHINYRRKNYHRSYIRFGYFSFTSLKWYRKQSNKCIRQSVRAAIHHESYDDLPLKYPKDILWKIT